MRCHICNTVLSPQEIQWNPDHKDWDPCTSCQEVIDSVFNDDTEEEIDAQLSFEWEELEDEKSDEENPEVS